MFGNLSRAFAVIEKAFIGFFFLRFLGSCLEKMNSKKLFPELLFTAERSSSGMRMLNFRKKFFWKLLFSIPEEVVPEVSSGTTSSVIENTNFRKKYFRKFIILIPELLPPLKFFWE